MDWRKFEYLRTSLEQGVAFVRVVDPNDDSFVEREHPMHRELRDVFTALDQDPEVAAIVFLGGDEHFCPAPRLDRLDALLKARPEAARHLQAEARDIVLNIISMRKPMVAGVGMDANGIGAQLAFSSDFVIAARGISFQDSHVRLGLIAGDGGTLVWPPLVGLPRARRHILRGQPLSSESAAELGLLEELVETPAEVPAASAALAEKLVKLPAAAYAASKQALNGWLRIGIAEAFDGPNAGQIESYEEPEFKARRDAATDKARGSDGEQR